MAVPIPLDEPERVAALRACDILDTSEEDNFEQITAAACEVCQTPIALLSFVDSGRQWCKSHRGVSWHETKRDVSFCAHAIAQPDILIVPNALEDERFRDNPLVTGDEHIRFYAGVPLRCDGHAIGTLCVLDRLPRALSLSQIDALWRLADAAACFVELRRADGRSLFAAALHRSHDAMAIVDVRRGADIVYANRAFLEFSGCRYHEVIGKPFAFPCPADLNFALENAVTRRMPVSVECEYRPHSKTVVDHIIVMPYMNAAGAVVYCLVVHRDLTRDRENEVQRHQLHGMQTTLRSINHVVLNFLNSVALFRQNVADKVDRPVLLQLDLAVNSMRSQLRQLSDMEEFKERPTEFGFTMLDPHGGRGKKV